MTSSPAQPDARKATGAPLRVGYVMTHYPRVALTFIDNEIAGVERHGIAVQPFAMNLPGDEDMLAPLAADKRARTVYLKASKTAAAGALLGALARHPIAMTRLTLRALASAGSDVGLMARRMAHLAQGALLAKRAAAADISHLHAHFGLAPATIAWFATEIGRAHRRDASFGFTIHGFHDFVEPMTARLDLKAAAARHVVCISDFTRSQLCRGTDPALWPRFRVVRCGVDLDRFVWRAPPPHGSAVTVMALGRLSAEKGFAVLIDAIAALRAEGVAVRLKLVGDGPLRGALAAQAQHLGIADAVEFAGERVPEDVARDLRAADIFCLPSFSEGLPVSIMEAMAIGVPVVTTWISGIPELAVDGETALTVPPARADRLADAIRRLAGDQALGAALSHAARAKVEALHDARHSAAQMAALLREDAA
jgi:glycosyltransferase involved in cell wall biosynthesis